MKKRIYLYGAGARCLTLYKLIKDEYNAIIIDSNPQMWGEKFVNEITIESPDKLSRDDNTMVVITTVNAKNYEDIYRVLCYKYNIKKSQILSYEQICWDKLKKKAKDSLRKKYIGNDRILEKNSVIFDAYCCQKLGGVEAWLIDLAEALKNRGDNVRLLTDDKNAVVNNKNYMYSDSVQRIGECYSTENLENYIAVKEYLIRKLPCTIVVNYGNVVTMAACDIKEQYGDKIKIISVIHNGNDSNYNRQSIFERDIDKYVCVAKDMITEMAKRGVSRGKLHSTTLPFECDNILNRRYTLNHDNPIEIGYAGRLDRVKNGQKRMDLILEVIRQLNEKEINFHMTFAGEGLARNTMQNIIENEGMQSKVTFLGMINRNMISSFWKKMDIGLNMADYEGRSISMLEMMANGVVPVFTNVSGATEDIVDGKNGFIVPCRDVRAAVKAVIYLEQNREKLPLMGRAAHDEVLPKGDWQESYDFWHRIVTD